MKVYGGFTQVELDRQYDQRALVPNVPEYRRENEGRSAEVRERLRSELNVSYGPSLSEVLDIFPAEQKNTPIMIYHHGGAWSHSSKDECSYIAECFVGKGVNLIVPGFALAPKVSLDEIVRQNRAAIAWAYHNSDRLGGNPERIYISGHSSGGHLVGMMIVTDWEGEYGLPKDLIKGATALSGIYDLEPVRLSYRNEYMFLDERSAARNSPIHHIPPVRIPLTIGYGDGEHDEFKRQSDIFAAAWKSAENPVRKIILKDQNHFDVQRQCANAHSPIMRVIWANMGLQQ